MAFISALVSAGLEGVSTIFDRMFFTKCTEVTLDHFNEIFRCKDCRDDCVLLSISIDLDMECDKRLI